MPSKYLDTLYMVMLYSDRVEPSGPLPVQVEMGSSIPLVISISTKTDVIPDLVLILRNASLFPPQLKARSMDINGCLKLSGNSEAAKIGKAE